MVPLSVLDLSPVGAATTPRQAILDSVALASQCDALGYTRYWVAEHHNMANIATSAPEVLIAHIAATTTRMRVGAGGIMLPNHNPLRIVEIFRTLEALHPGRIDLGLGRAPGTDPVTAHALRRSEAALSADEFPAQLADLVGFFTGEMPEGHPYRRITAVPALGHRPSLWLLGSSGYSAQVAGILGLPFSFAHHFSAENTLPALELYRSTFRPSVDLERPYAMVAVSVVCAESSERARWLAGSGSLAFLRLRSGRPGKLPTPEEAAAYGYTPAEKEMVRRRMATQVIGDPDEVLAGLAELAERTEADELMLTTFVHGHADRLRSYELVASAAGLEAGSRVGP